MGFLCFHRKRPTYIINKYHNTPRLPSSLHLLLSLDHVFLIAAVATLRGARSLL
ncbi:hypothetical protein E8E11_000842 [Didymella keratinophila]|nr:hypothetical protein E8E11_000842 [Didymella keratinophila]